MQTVLIIGSGFIGWPLALSFKDAGFNVMVTATQISKQAELEKAGITLLTFDCTNNDDYNQFSKFSIYHLIFTLPPKACEPLSYVDVLKKLKNCLTIHSTFSFTSSSSVYKNNGKHHTEKSTKLNPGVILEAEQFIQEQYTQHYIFRLAGLIGGTRHPQNFIKNSEIRNSDQPVNLVLGSDVVEIVTRAISCNIPFGIYNVCAPEHPSRKEFYKQYIAEPKYTEGDEGKIIDGTLISEIVDYAYTNIYLPPLKI